MKQRVIFGSICALVTIACIVLSVYTRVAFLVLASMIAGYEMAKAFKNCGLHVEKWPAFLLCTFCTGLLCVNKSGYVFPVFMIIMIALFGQMILTGRPNVRNLYATIGIMAYPLSPLLLMVYIALKNHLWAPVFLNAILPAIISDTFALFGGMLLGKHKLAPHISPKKTWEGLFSGLIFGTLSGFAVYYILGAFDKNIIPLWAVMVSAFLSAVAGAFGDLAASAVKREAGIKDYGNLIPGHGGILDRVDSAIFAIPVCYMMYAMFV